MKNTAAPRSFSDPHRNVTLTTSAQSLPAGQFEVCGYFYPRGHTGERVPQYRFYVDSRAAYDATVRRISRAHGNTVKGAETLFDALRPAAE